MTNLILSLMSLVIASFALANSIYWAKRTYRRSIRPVLVFSRRAKGEWQIENVGGGPALNILIGCMDAQGRWKRIVQFGPIAAGISLKLLWDEPGYGLGARYEDVNGKTDATLNHDGRTQIGPKDTFANWKPTESEGDLQRADAAKKAFL